RDVDDIDPVVVEQLVKGGVGAADVDLLRPGGGAVARGAEQAGNVDADPAQGLDVHRADEAAADHGGADVAASCHWWGGASGGLGCQPSSLDGFRRERR